MDLAEGPRWILSSNDGDSVNANRYERNLKPFATELQAQFCRRSSLTPMKFFAKAAQAARS